MTGRSLGFGCDFLRLTTAFASGSARLRRTTRLRFSIPAHFALAVSIGPFGRGISAPASHGPPSRGGCRVNPVGGWRVITS